MITASSTMLPCCIPCSHWVRLLVSAPIGSPSPHIMMPAVIKVPTMGITKIGITERSTLCTGIFFK
ncbi:Uncharacterised protein [Salmonella enterica subsp. enterica serovar Bovismorbificans]|uniref:Uncharacterized protein n=1 Tax=Salmonella enterica subsp. enterica serovar Bovismorbificans TaxID=58097 RepID=A0A655BXI7_SALET|nr:Uncharacterised protein [Salmonella enterica subsp. enterica serovar Bovismorbificans]